MSTTEQLWFAVGIAGFVLLLQGFSGYILERFLPRLNKNIGIFITGILIYVIAVIALFNI